MESLSRVSSCVLPGAGVRSGGDGGVCWGWIGGDIVAVQVVPGREDPRSGMQSSPGDCGSSSQLTRQNLADELSGLLTTSHGF